MDVTVIEIIWNLKRLIREAFPQGLYLNQLESQYKKYFECVTFPNPNSMKSGCRNWHQVFRKSDKFRKWFQVDTIQRIQVRPIPERDLAVFFKLVRYSTYRVARQSAKVDEWTGVSTSESEDEPGDDAIKISDSSDSDSSTGHACKPRKPKIAEGAAASGNSSTNAQLPHFQTQISATAISSKRPKSNLVPFDPRSCARQPRKISGAAVSSNREQAAKEQNISLENVEAALKSAMEINPSSRRVSWAPAIKLLNVNCLSSSGPLATSASSSNITIPQVSPTILTAVNAQAPVRAIRAPVTSIKSNEAPAVSTLPRTAPTATSSFYSVSGSGTPIPVISSQTPVSMRPTPTPSVYGSIQTQDVAPFMPMDVNANNNAPLPPAIWPYHGHPLFSTAPTFQSYSPPCNALQLPDQLRPRPMLEIQHQLNELMQPDICKLCDARLQSLQSRVGHYNGKRHKAGIQNWLTENGIKLEVAVTEASDCLSWGVVKSWRTPQEWETRWIRLLDEAIGIVNSRSDWDSAVTFTHGKDLRPRLVGLRQNFIDGFCVDASDALEARNKILTALERAREQEGKFPELLQEIYQLQYKLDNEVQAIIEDSRRTPSVN